jgi:hypothetical protein
MTPIGFSGDFSFIFVSYRPSSRRRLHLYRHTVHPHPGSFLPPVLPRYPFYILATFLNTPLVPPTEHPIKDTTFSFSFNFFRLAFSPFTFLLLIHFFNFTFTFTFILSSSLSPYPSSPFSFPYFAPRQTKIQPHLFLCVHNGKHVVGVCEER